MPTCASRPSLEETQAVGAILLHQFARERFLNAGIDENLICEAEDRAHLDALASKVLYEECEASSGDTTTFSTRANETQPNNNTSSLSNGNGTASRADLGGDNEGNQRNNRSHGLPVSGTPSGYHKELTNTILQGNNNNTTVRNDDDHHHGHHHDRPSELFHSINESVTLVPQQADGTLYQSMNNSTSNPPASSSPFERLQASPCLASYGRELRKIADEFEKTRLRGVVKEKAGGVSLSDITKEKFIELLEELFEGKITRARIVILFFFCTDVALRAALAAQDLVVKLLGWSFSFIVETVCSFVYKLGGWDKVLFYNFIFHQLPSLMITGCALMAMIWFGINIRRSLRD
uniref:Apoptosis regulator BAX n=1 Tax=Aceria tosichella TaxID=561515 RepID=A0A6G1SKJ1_9ACAR